MIPLRLKHGTSCDDTAAGNKYRVGTLVGSTVPLPITQTSYQLDAVGNWEARATNASTQTRLHNAANEITAIDSVPILSDDNGNIQQDEGFLYEYDDGNRLIRAIRTSDSQVVGEYVYDALGRRISRWANASGTPTETCYFYDESRVIEEQTDTGTTLATYVFGIYVDEVLSMTRGGMSYFFHENGLWSVSAVSDSTGNVVERYSYEAYGEPTVTDGFGVLIPPNGWGTAHSAVGNPYLFTGREYDEETGLYSYRARYYDSEKGRFLQRDPLGYVDGQNLYEYAKSNPLLYTDPTGEAVETVWDVVNIGTGVVSLVSNCASGNVVGALVDVGGILIDTTAAIVPGVPGGAGTVIKTVRLSKSSARLVKNMLNTARSVNGKGGGAVKRMLRYTVTKFDNGHHLIPWKGPSEKWVGGVLRSRMDALRKRAAKIGLDLDDAANGVSLPKKWHLDETTAAAYYERVLNKFRDLPDNKSDWIKALDDLAEELMKESGKLK